MMDMYEKHPFEDFSIQQLNDIEQYGYPFTNEKIDSIYTRFQNKRQPIRRNKRFSKKLIIALVAVMAISMVGFTNADRIQQLFQQYFGNAELERYARDISESCTDQGFRMDVLTAASDGENTYLFVDLVDEAGDRLNEDLYIENGYMDTVKFLGENVTSMSSIGTRLLHYDSGTKTATLTVHATGNFKGNKTVFTLGVFATGRTEVDAVIPDFNLYELARTHTASFQPFDIDKFGSVGYSYANEFDDMGLSIEDITECLELDTMDIRFTGYDLDYISGIGYRDGYLHVQIKREYIGWGKHVSLILQNTKTGQEMRPVYNLSYGVNILQRPEEERDLYPGYHDEEVYYIGDIENLKDYTVRLEGQYYKNIYQGKWEVAFDVPIQMDSADVPAGKSVLIGGRELVIDKITVTPLGVTFIAQSAIESNDGNYTVAVISKDGKRMEIGAETQMYVHENGRQEWQYIGPILDFENLGSVEINGTRFDLKAKE